jgi:hypothetical protein
MSRQDLLLKDYHARRVIMAALSIAEADVNGSDPVVRKMLHLDLERALRDAAEAGLPRIYRDTVRILETMADLEATGLVEDDD